MDGLNVCENISWNILKWQNSVPTVIIPNYVYLKVDSDGMCTGYSIVPHDDTNSRVTDTC